VHFVGEYLHENPFSGIRVPCGRTDMTKPTVAVCNFASALENDGASILQLPNVCTSSKLISRVWLNVCTHARTQLTRCRRRKASSPKSAVSHFYLVDCVWNVMAHAQKPDFVFRRNGRFHLNRRGRQFNQLLAVGVCASGVAMLDTPCSEIVWSVLATHYSRQFPLHFPSLRRVPSHFNWPLAA